jgi:hypothetical protein
LPFNFALQYAIRSVQVNQYGLKLNDAHQLLMYVDYVNVLDESVRTIEKNTESLVAASKDIGLSVNAEQLSPLSCLEIRMLDEVTI